MSVPSEATVHYQAAFELKAIDGGAVDWFDHLQRIRRWLGRKTRQATSLGGKWFLVEGDWRMPGSPRTTVQVRSYSDDGLEERPRGWAMEFQHPCSQFSFRQWATQIGLYSEDDGSIRFAIRVSHWLPSSYVGREPQPPSPSAPSLLREILEDPDVQAQSGSLVLRDHAVRLIPGDGDDFKRILVDADRHLPAVYISLDFGTGEPLIEPKLVATALCGAASVYVASNSELDKELEYLLPKKFRCWNGMLRVYMPHVDLSSSWDDRRHRFFLARDLRTEDPAEVISMLVRAIARSSIPRPRGFIFALRDIDDAIRERRLAELRSSVKAAPSSEEMTLLWEELDVLGRDKRELQVALDSARSRLEQTEAQQGATQEARDWWKRRAAALEREANDAKKAAGAVGALAILPETIEDCVKLVTSLHAGRIAFTEEALHAAADASFRDVGQAWHCLWEMATTLYDLYFGTAELAPAEIARAFRSRSGFELALTESSATNKHSRLSRLRKVQYDGREIDMSPHVKIGTVPPNCLRVHFGVDRETKCIVIGHCGDHLTTAGTRRAR